jgi:hypothetical protein
MKPAHIPVLVAAVALASACSSGGGESDVRELGPIEVVGLDLSYSDSTDGEELADQGTPDDAAIPDQAGDEAVQPVDLVETEEVAQPTDPGADEAVQPTDPGEPDEVVADEAVAEEVGPCLNEPTVNGFRDNCNGTVTDNKTGKTWQRGMFQAGTFNDAKSYCSTLTLADLTGWHLPTIDELRGLVIDCPATASGGACNVHDSCHGQLFTSCDAAACDGCAMAQGTGPQGCYYDASFEQACFPFISSTQPKAEQSGDYRSWHVDFLYAAVDRAYEYTKSGGWVRCVR